MKHLLDVNVLVAWGWADHVDHDRVATWIAGVMRKRGDQLLTSPIPQLGFVRVSVQRTGGITTLGPTHEFLADDRRATRWPEWCRNANQTTDAHLLALAEAVGAKLATLDLGIPGAFVIPSVSGKRMR